jgi:hypothetical protein
MIYNLLCYKLPKTKRMGREKHIIQHPFLVHLKNPNVRIAPKYARLPRLHLASRLAASLGYCFYAKKGSPLRESEGGLQNISVFLIIPITTFFIPFSLSVSLGAPSVELRVISCSTKFHRGGTEIHRGIFILR